MTWLSHVATRNFKLAKSFGAALAEIMVVLRSTLIAMPVPQRLNASHPTPTTHVSEFCHPSFICARPRLWVSAPALCTDCNVSRGLAAGSAGGSSFLPSLFVCGFHNNTMYLAR